MEQAISDASYAKIALLYNMGIEFPTTKISYSDLFMKKSAEAFDSQQYVIEKCKDITIGNQVILKTLLHAQRKSTLYNNNPELKLQLITQILNKYTSEQLEQLPEALKKRTKSDETELVQKFYDYSQLKKEIEDSPDSANEIERRKLKI